MRRRAHSNDFKFHISRSIFNRMNSQGKYHCWRAACAPAASILFSFLIHVITIFIFFPSLSLSHFQPGISFHTVQWKIIPSMHVWREKNCIVVPNENGNVLTSIPCRSIGSYLLSFRMMLRWRKKRSTFYLSTSSIRSVVQMNNSKN